MDSVHIVLTKSALFRQIIFPVYLFIDLIWFPDWNDQIVNVGWRSLYEHMITDEGKALLFIHSFIYLGL